MMIFLLIWPCCQQMFYFDVSLLCVVSQLSILRSFYYFVSHLYLISRQIKSNTYMKRNQAKIPHLGTMVRSGDISRLVLTSTDIY